MDKIKLVPCPLCQSSQFLGLTNTNSDDHIQKYGDLYGGRKLSEWKTCGTCGFVLQNPRPSSAALNEFYLKSQYHGEITWNPEDYKRFAEWYYLDKVDYIIQKTGLKTGTVFDVGFGLGGALLAFQKRGWKTYGVESDKTSYEFVQRQFRFDKVENNILTSDISDDFKVDVVFSNHAFEHIADLPDVLGGIQKILKPGGYIFTCVPTYYSNRSRLSKLWMNSAHYNLFTHKSLNHFLYPAGVTEVTHTYRGFWKEIDELWHLGQRQHQAISASIEETYENPKAVQFYINVLNPLRSLLYWPLFSEWSKRVQLFLSIQRNYKIIFSDPVLLVKKIIKKIS